MTASPRTPGLRKSLGQHFLHDTSIVSRIVEAAELSPDDTVIEIGPGRGVLTRQLVQAAGRVIAVELDERLRAELPARLHFPPNLECLHADARETDFPGMAMPLDGAMEGGYKVIGNLPYYAANPIIRRVLESRPPPKLLLVMVQKEVADSMTAKPESMTLLSVATQCYAAARQVCSVPPGAFRPPPKVRSAVVRLDLLEAPVVDEAHRKAFFEVARAGFSAPRKQLHNSLSHGLGVETRVGAETLEKAGIDGRRRPATLSVEEWVAVYESWQRVRQETEARGD